MVDGGYAILKRVVAVARFGNGKPRPSDSLKALDEHEDEGETGHLYIDRGEMWSCCACLSLFVGSLPKEGVWASICG